MTTPSAAPGAAIEMTDRLSEFEQAVLDKFLSGDDPVLEQLRRQARSLRVTAREATGVGFYVDFAIDDGVPPLVGDSDLEIADVNADLEGLAHGAGFVLFVRSGYIAFLEGFSFGEPWPSRIGAYRLHFGHEPRDLKLWGTADGTEQSRASARVRQVKPLAVFVIVASFGLAFASLARWPRE